MRIIGLASCLLLISASGVFATGGTLAQEPALQVVHLSLYEEEVSFGLSGDATFTTRIDIVGGLPARILLPFGGGVAEDLTVRPSKGVDVTLVDVAGTLAVELRLDTAGKSLRTLTVQYTLPRLHDWSAPPEAWGNRKVSHEIVHTQHLRIDRYELRMILPDGFRVNQVLGTIPAFDSKKASELPFELVEIDGRAAVELVALELVLGDRVGLKLEAKSDRRGAFVWMAGVVISLLYLIFFRDVLLPSEEAEPS